MSGALLSAFFALKLGLYAPAPWPMGAWWKVGVNLGGNDRTYAVEIAATVEPREISTNIFGKPAQKIVWTPAYFVGVSKRLSNDLDASAGLKYRDAATGYVGFSFKFGTLRGRRPCSIRKSQSKSRRSRS